MKNKITKLALLLLAVATGNAAQAQALFLEAGKAYVFSGTAAVGTGNITYQWYRNGQPIEGATDQNYTLPSSLAYSNNINVEFKRRAVSSACPLIDNYTNVTVINFVELVINGTRWALYNADANNTFAPTYDSYGSFFQWNRTVAYPATDTAGGWNSTPDSYARFIANPCPPGWRVPSQENFQALVASGSTWVDANSILGNAVAGRFYGQNHAECLIPDNFQNCIFLPAVGYRSSGAEVTDQGISGFYWFRQVDLHQTPYTMMFNESQSGDFETAMDRIGAMSVRCVQ